MTSHANFREYLSNLLKVDFVPNQMVLTSVSEVRSFELFVLCLLLRYLEILKEADFENNYFRISSNYDKH